MRAGSRCEGSRAAITGLAVALAGAAGADEQLVAFTRGAETLPKGRTELYPFFTLRTSKDSGDFHGFDFDTEVEHGFTDRFQASVALVS